MKTVITALLFLFASSASAQCYYVIDTYTNEFCRIKIDANSYTRVTEMNLYNYPIDSVTTYKMQEGTEPCARFNSNGDPLICVTVWNASITEYNIYDTRNYDILLYLDSLNMPVRVFQERSYYLQEMIYVYRDGIPGLDALIGKQN